MGHTLPTPEWFPQIHYVFNKHLAFDFNWPFLWALANELYYILLEPVAGVSGLSKHCRAPLTAFPPSCYMPLRWR